MYYPGKCDIETMEQLLHIVALSVIPNIQMSNSIEYIYIQQT